MMVVYKNISTKKTGQNFTRLLKKEYVYEFKPQPSIFFLVVYVIQARYSHLDSLAITHQA